MLNYYFVGYFIYYIDEKFLVGYINITYKLILPTNIGQSWVLEWTAPLKTDWLIRYFTENVIGYVVLNRKCAMCNKSHPKEERGCSLNFISSVKATEPRAALLTKDNPVLKRCHLKVGIMIANKDSSSICTMREASNHGVIEQNDKNHTLKGVVKAWFELKIKKNYKELTVAVIDYLKKNFNYSVSQNKENSNKMSKAIENIVFYCFNDHKKWGS